MKDDSKKRYYHVWCCDCRDKTMRPRGKPIKPGCGLWSVYSSKHHYYEVRLQPKCEFCDRKKNLRPDHSKVYVVHTRGEAIQNQEMMNGMARGTLL